MPSSISPYNQHSRSLSSYCDASSLHTELHQPPSHSAFAPRSLYVVHPMPMPPSNQYIPTNSPNNPSSVLYKTFLRHLQSRLPIRVISHPITCTEKEKKETEEGNNNYPRIFVYLRFQSCPLPKTTGIDKTNKNELLINLVPSPEVSTYNIKTLTYSPARLHHPISILLRLYELHNSQIPVIHKRPHDPQTPTSPRIIRKKPISSSSLLSTHLRSPPISRPRYSTPPPLLSLSPILVPAPISSSPPPPYSLLTHLPRPFPLNSVILNLNPIQQSLPLLLLFANPGPPSAVTRATTTYIYHSPFLLPHPSLSRSNITTYSSPPPSPPPILLPPPPPASPYAPSIFQETHNKSFVQNIN